MADSISNGPQLADITRRGISSAYHLGVWMTRGGKFYKWPLPTVDSSGVIAEKLMKYAAKIAHKAGHAVRQLAPVVAADLSTIPSQYRPFDLWPLLIANFLSPQKAHTDFEDYHGGYCCLVLLGQYNGGALYFPELKLTIPCLPGDIVLFRSDLLQHQVLPYEGLRMSLIFTAHGRFMKWIEKDPHLGTQNSSAQAVDEAIENIVGWRNDLNKRKVSPTEGIAQEGAEDQTQIQFPLFNRQNPPPPPSGSPRAEHVRHIPQDVWDAYHEREQIIKEKC